MTDQNNEARDMWAEALSLMFKGDHQEELFRISDDEIDALEGLSPDRWPTAGQTDINWDLSVPGRRHSIYLPGPRVLQPAPEPASALLHKIHRALYIPDFFWHPSWDKSSPPCQTDYMPELPGYEFQ